MPYVKRHLSEILKERFKLARSVYIFGARQTGKTTLAQKAFPKLPYSSLEDPDIRQYASEDPRGYLSQFQQGAVLDEIQRAPELFSYLQAIIDSGKRKFVLTGSQNFLLLEKVSQTLAGRISLIELSPFSLSEKAKHPFTPFPKIFSKKIPVTASLKSFVDPILTGGYPEVVVKPGLRSFWFSDYVRTYVERDVKQILNVHNTIVFQNFIKLCAGRSGGILNTASLSSDAGISATNCRHWLSLLQASGIIYLLGPYHYNFRKRLIKAPKLYFSDTGLLCHLLGIKSAEHLKTHPLLGNIFETFIANEIKKCFLNAGSECPMFYWRNSAGLEVDLIIESHPELYAVEIKSSQTLSGDSFKNLLKWKDMAKDYKVNLVLFYAGEDNLLRKTVRIRSWSSLS